MGQGQSLLALTVVKNALHECRLQGCNMSVPFDQIKEHEKKCDWRLVICPGSGHTCTGMTPFCTVLTHVQNCPDCYMMSSTQDNASGTVLQNTMGTELHSHLMLYKADAYSRIDLDFKTKIIQTEQGSVSFVKFGRKGDIYMIDVVMKGSKEDCKEVEVEASILDSVSGKSMFKATFQPRPLSNQNEAAYCLSVPERCVSQVWKLDELKKKYRIDYVIKFAKLE